MSVVRGQTCCFTGHRNIPKCDEQKILTRVRYILVPLMDQGVKYFCVGGAVGFDMISAEFLLQLRDRYGKRIKVISVLPYPEWREGWPEDLFHRQDLIMGRSDKVVYACPENCKDAFLIRDRKLVEGSAYCVSYCNRRNGGTAYTVRYAMKRGLQVFNASSWDLRQLYL